MLKLILPIALNLICSFSLLAQNKSTEVITNILYHYTNDSTPGIAVGIVKDGEIVYEHYIGYANLSHDVKISEKTRFNIASTAKQYTALMVLQLALQDKLSLEDDIRKYLPNLYPRVKEEIKIRQVINHTSGMRDYVELLGLKDEIWWKQIGLNNNDIMELVEKQEELGFKPGSQYVYSNTGYIILAKIIEAVTAEKFTTYSKNFFQQMGMAETYFVERYMGVIPNRAEPYYDWGNGLWLKTPTVTKICGDGFLFTTLKDQMHYEQSLHQMKSTDTLLQRSQQAVPNNENTSYGFGLELSNWSGRAAVHHSGATYGYHSQLIRFQEEKLTVLVLSNNGNLRSDKIADSIASVLLPAIEVKKELQYDPLYYEGSAENEKALVLGQYLNDKGSIIRIVEQDGKTYWKKENGALIKIDEESSNQFAIHYDTNMKVRFSQAGMILFEPNGELTEYVRSSAYTPSISDLEGMEGTYLNRELDISFVLELNEKQQMSLSLSTNKYTGIVEFLSEKKFIVDSYTLNIERDAFGRIQDILLNYDRAKNIRFRRKSNLRFQPKIALEEGYIQVSTIGSEDGETSDILLTRNDDNGNEVWFKRFGGKSYDRASSIRSTEDGYLIIGSTSSFGNGNYDVYIIKTDKKGKKQWQNTFGGHFNEYGFMANATEEGYLIKGTVQQCNSNDLLAADCITKVYIIHVDRNGNKLSEEILEKVE